MDIIQQKVPFQYSSVYSLFANQTRLSLTKKVFQSIYGVENQAYTYTYLDILRMASLLASGMQQMYLLHQTKSVLVISKSQIETYVIILACSALSVDVSIVSDELSVKEIQKIQEDVRADLIFLPFKLMEHIDGQKIILDDDPFQRSYLVENRQFEAPKLLFFQHIEQLDSTIDKNAYFKYQNEIIQTKPTDFQINFSFHSLITKQAILMQFLHDQNPFYNNNIYNFLTFNQKHPLDIKITAFQSIIPDSIQQSILIQQSVKLARKRLYPDFNIQEVAHIHSLHKSNLILAFATMIQNGIIHLSSVQFCHIVSPTYIALNAGSFKDFVACFNFQKLNFKKSKRIFEKILFEKQAQLYSNKQIFINQLPKSQNQKYEIQDIQNQIGGRLRIILIEEPNLMISDLLISAFNCEILGFSMVENAGFLSVQAVESLTRAQIGQNFTEAPLILPHQMKKTLLIGEEQIVCDMEFGKIEGKELEWNVQLGYLRVIDGSFNQKYKLCSGKFNVNEFETGKIVIFLGFFDFAFPKYLKESAKRQLAWAEHYGKDLDQQEFNKLIMEIGLFE
ncbi:hypothetical protein SS50377_24704 [Spironucleus salmonicida]|uniref:AMP-dependent synthetase/ligase domain-containing protein n=1 Tax=Spironucleus salmonicida TaxID=348837 RepID=V6LIZ6_9EUKA|nr:hypothetical protein SS50377_24704 [Spironucleus salmonicida]|eukprot:EST44585.1 hypothetical protein SS50377_15589 [Spironucleus salmonicida]